jgi:hypothetical protein
MCTVSGIAPFISISKAWRLSTIVASPSRQSSLALAKLISQLARSVSSARLGSAGSMRVLLGQARA